MNKKLILLTGILLSSLTIFAQDNARQDVLPTEVLNASIQDLNGKSFRLAESKGELQIVLLWAAWCGPCRYAIEDLNKISGTYARRNIEIIGLSIDDPVKDMKGFRDFMRSTKIRFKIGWADEKLGKAVIGSHPGSIPQILVVAADGHVVKRFIGYNPAASLKRLNEAVEQYLAGQNKEK